MQHVFSPVSESKNYVIALFTMFNWQLRESQLATHSVKEAQAELQRRYHEKVGQWESSQEALDQLTDELQANQNRMKDSQQKVNHFKSLMVTLQEQVDTLKQQVRPHMYTWHRHKYTHTNTQACAQSFISKLQIFLQSSQWCYVFF